MPNVFKNIENLVFQGGGVKGIAYLGAIQQLLDSRNESHLTLPQIERVGGASAGAITAFLLAVGNDIAEINTILSALNFSDLLDDGDRLQGFTTKQAILKFNEILNSNPDKALDYLVFIVCEICCKISQGILPVLAKKEIEQAVIENIPFAKVILECTLIDKLIAKFGGYLANGLDKIKDFILARLSNMNLVQLNGEILSFFSSQTEMTDFISSMSMIAISFVSQGKRGIFSGNVFLEWIQSQLKNAKLDPQITFAEFELLLKGRPELKALYVVVLNLSSGIAEVFSNANQNTRNVLICDAVRASMSIPYFFEPIDVRFKSDTTISRRRDLYADGGVLENYPV